MKTISKLVQFEVLQIKEQKKLLNGGNACQQLPLYCDSPFANECDHGC